LIEEEDMRDIAVPDGHKMIITSDLHSRAVWYNMIMKIQKRYFSVLSMLLLLAVLSGCDYLAKFDEVDQGFDSNPESSISFNGIDSITNVTDTTATINWTNIGGASSYSIFSVSGSTLTFIGVVTAPTETYALTGLTPSTALKFKVRAYDSSGDGDLNNNIVSITTDGAPASPSGLALTTPALSPGFDNTPTITVSGVKSGDTIKLFTDSACSTEVGSAVSSGTTIAVTTSTLAAASYTFYANATGAGGSSTCSIANVSYTINACPTGYISVPSMAAVNAHNNFCVMKYEAKNDGSGNAVSTETGAPWVSIDQTTAKTECTDLNALNGVTNKYDLISNPEWMAIARNVENVASNWTDAAVGSGCLKRGNVGSTSACTGGDSGYNGADPESGAGRNALASLTLDNGEVIWDLSGNVWEWTDWTLGGALSTNMSQANKPYDATDGAPVAGWRELTSVDTFSALAPAESILPDNPSFSAVEGMGRYYASTSGGAALRSGAWAGGTNAGAFALYLSASSSDTYTSFGFRCVFRP
jgi:formylglycine-generating enzyme required for sulfatase activity